MEHRIKLQEQEESFATKLTEAIQGQLKNNDGGVIVLDQSIVDGAEVDKLREARANASRELRELDKELKREVDIRVFWIKLLNIVPMALVVIAIGLIHYMLRRTRTAAR